MLQTDLIEKCKNNDSSAQLQLYRQYCDGMYCVAMRFVKDSMEAEDIVQDSFLKAFTKIDQFNADVTFGAWLKRIVINEAIDQLKKRKAQFLQLEEVHLKVVDDTLQDIWLVEDAITVEEVKEAIQTLADKYRYVVMLYLVEGYDHQEISEILHITEVASRTQLSRGKKKLQSILKKTRYGTRY